MSHSDISFTDARTRGCQEGNAAGAGRTSSDESSCHGVKLFPCQAMKPDDLGTLTWKSGGEGMEGNNFIGDRGSSLKLATDKEWSLKGKTTINFHGRYWKISGNAASVIVWLRRTLMILRNIPGFGWQGRKTATKIIAQFGSINAMATWKK